MGWMGWKEVLRSTGESKDSIPEKQTDTRGRICPGLSLKGQRKASVADFSPNGLSGRGERVGLGHLRARAVRLCFTLSLLGLAGTAQGLSLWSVISWPSGLLGPIGNSPEFPNFLIYKMGTVLYLPYKCDH